MKKRFRTKKLNNWIIQGPLVVRLMMHCFAYTAATLFLLISASGIRNMAAAFTNSPVEPAPVTLWQHAAPVALCITIMIPFMIWDLMKLTNKIAGPLYRFEVLMKDFVKSGTLKTAVLRDGDLLLDFQKHFNEFAEALHALHPDTRPAVSESQPEESQRGEDSTAILETLMTGEPRSDESPAANRDFVREPCEV